MYAPERNTSLEIILEKGSYMLLIATYYPDIWENFTMTIWSKKNKQNCATLDISKLN